MSGASIQMQAKLAEAGIPSKRIHCYGSQIVITTASQSAAEKWADLLGKFATVRAMVGSYDDRADAKPGARGGDKYVRVFRVFATISGAQA